jgi:pimeloyl-ACP methyl ester carboxylesterase
MWHGALMKLPSLCLVLAVALLPACMFSRSTEGPMQLVNDLLACNTRPTTLIVMLPGVYDKPQDFLDQGFVKAVRERGIDADVQLADAHIGYYNNQQIVNRLHDEVVLPAKAKGYQKIWLVGISLGGYGTLLYSMTKPGWVQGFFTMAPYMGSREVPAEVQGQGGLKTWSSNVQGNMDVDLWRWLQGYTQPEVNLPMAYLGFGTSDRFVKPNTLLANVLPKERSFAVPGGHDWETWLKVWASFLDVAPLPRLEERQSKCAAR